MKIKDVFMLVGIFNGENLKKQETGLNLGVIFLSRQDCMPVIPVLVRLRQEDSRFEASLSN